MRRVSPLVRILSVSARTVDAYLRSPQRNAPMKAPIPAASGHRGISKYLPILITVFILSWPRGRLDRRVDEMPLAPTVVVVDLVWTRLIECGQVHHQVPAVTGTILDSDRVDLGAEGEALHRSRASANPALEGDLSVLVEEPQSIEQLFARWAISDGPIARGCFAGVHPNLLVTTLE